MEPVKFKDFANKLREVSREGFSVDFETRYYRDGWFLLRLTKEGKAVTRECHADDEHFENIIKGIDCMVEDWKVRFLL